MGRTHLLLLTLPLMALGLGCGDEAPGSDEATAMQALDVAGAALQALSTTSALSVDASAAQDDDPEEVEEPTNVEGQCVTVALQGLALVIDYGMGCQVGNNFVSGAYVLRLLLQQQLGLQLEFQMFEIDGLGIDGTVSAGIGQDRINATMDLDLTEAGVTKELDFLGSLWTQPGFLLFFDGSGAYVEGASRWAFDATNIRTTVGACYPDEGVLTLSDPSGVPVSITFLSTTPQTGLVEVRVNRLTFALPLPSYGACPPPSA